LQKEEAEQEVAVCMSSLRDGGYGNIFQAMVGDPILY
jgi:hypothetical protein